MRCITISVTVSLLAILCHAVPARAQYQIDSWTTDQGLPQNSVQAILQTRDGYLWLTTFDGLVRFDGVRFTVFNRANTTGIKSNRFTALYEDRDGILWIGSEHSIVTRYDGMGFESFTIREGSGLIQGIAGDDSGRMWIRRDDRILEWRGRGTDAKCRRRIPNSSISDPASTGAAASADSGVRTTHGLKLFVRGEVTNVTERDGLWRGAVHAVAEDERHDLDCRRWGSGASAGSARKPRPRVSWRPLPDDHGGRNGLAGCGAGMTRLAFSPRMTRLCFDDRANRARQARHRRARHALPGARRDDLGTARRGVLRRSRAQPLDRRGHERIAPIETAGDDDLVASRGTSRSQYLSRVSGPSRRDLAGAWLQRRAVSMAAASRTTPPKTG